MAAPPSPDLGDRASALQQLIAEFKEYYSADSVTELFNMNEGDYEAVIFPEMLLPDLPRRNVLLLEI